MLAVFVGQWSELDATWNLEGLGWNAHISRTKMEKASLLHWNGKRRWHPLIIKSVPPESVVWIFDTFDNNFDIEYGFTKYLME